MKINRFALNMLKLIVNSDIKKRRKHYPDKSEFRSFIDIPYLNDKNPQHTYDVYLADESNRKHCLVIDIHGGSYIFGKHYDNYPYGYVLLKAGYDIALFDYEPNNGKKDISDIVNDLVANLKHLFDRLDEYGLSNDKVVISGDSAGGHLALLLSLALQAQEVRDTLGIKLPNIDVLATVIACPVYDYENIAVSLAESGQKRMLGPKYNDKEHLRKYSPRTYIEFNKAPLFLSTCKNDFIRPQSIMLNDEMKNKSGYVFLDINSDDKKVDHVHNITKIDLKESIEVNDAIVKFIDNLL